MSWVVASDQFRQLALLRKLQKIKAWVQMPAQLKASQHATELLTLDWRVNYALFQEMPKAGTRISDRYLNMTKLRLLPLF